MELRLRIINGTKIKDHQLWQWLTYQFGSLMPGDPKECRRHAARCAELAIAARTPQLKAAFLGLSKNWEKLAIQLEDVFANLAESEDIGLKVAESINEAQQLSALPIWKQ
jgi:hypothetical protein